MTVPKFLSDKYGSVNPDDITEKKLSDKCKQERFVINDGVPDLVEMDASECETLCKAVNYRMQPGDEKRIVRYTFTTGRVDRYGDVVVAKGVDLKSYKKNPVVLTFHDYSQFPVGKSIKTWYDKDTDSVKGDVLFFNNDIDPTGVSEAAFRFAKAGAMTTGSIGFLPIEAERPSKEKRAELKMGEHGVLFKRSELLEYSLTPVPANPDAKQDSIRRGVYSFDAIDKAVGIEPLQKAGMCALIADIKGLVGEKDAAEKKDADEEVIVEVTEEETKAETEALLSQKFADLETKVNCLISKLEARGYNIDEPEAKGGSTDSGDALKAEEAIDRAVALMKASARLKKIGGKNVS